jgi:glycosyltransferase involved in cell wall biosynthesis
MKVLLLTTSNSRNAGGLYPAVKCLGQALFKNKKIKPVIYGFRDNHSATDIKSYEPVRLEEYHIIGPPGVGLTLDLGWKIRKDNPDVIHINGIWMYTSYVNKSYTAKYNKPYIISPHGMLDPWITHTRAWKKKIGLFLYEKEHLANAACIHALTDAEYKSIRSFGCKNPIAIIPNGVHLPRYENLTATENFSWKEDNRKNVLFLSRLHPKKGLDNLIKAWARIGEHRKSWKLVIAGESKDKSYINSLKKLQSELYLENDVIFIGSQFNRAKELCFKSSDAFILPSFSEGMPIAALEAWSHRLPSLLTKECNMPEGFERNASIEIEPNVESIVKGLEKLFLLSENELEQMKTNAYELVKQKYTWDSIGKQMNDVYEWILTGGSPPSCVYLD